MIEGGRRPRAWTDEWAKHQRWYVTPSARQVEWLSLVEDHEHHAIPQRGALEQRWQEGGKPGVALMYRTVVHVVAEVRDD